MSEYERAAITYVNTERHLSVDAVIIGENGDGEKSWLANEFSVKLLLFTTRDCWTYNRRWHL